MPDLEVGPSNSIQMDVFHSAGVPTGGTQIAAASGNYFGVGATGTARFGNTSNLGGAVQRIGSNDVYTFAGFGYPQAEQYSGGTIMMVTIYWAGGSTVLTSQIATTLGPNWVNYNFFGNSAFPSSAPTAGGTSAVQVWSMTCKKTGFSTTGDYFYVSAGTLPTAVTAWDMVVSILPSLA